MPRLLHELFERSKDRDPERIAVEVVHGADVHTVTYGELWRAADSISARLADRVGGECIVAIALPKHSPHVHAAQLAVLRAGAAFVCIDLAFPDEHVRAVLDDARPVAVLTEAAHAARWHALGVDAGGTIAIDVAEREGPAAAPPEPAWLGPSSLAYVVYTSGTTGTPKGVMIEHASVVHLLLAEQRHFALRPDDRCVQVSSHAYDSSIEESWLPFAAGATVVVADDDAVRLGPDFVAWLRERSISVLMPTPTLLRSTGCADPARELPRLRIVYTGGEAITNDLVTRWADACQLENGYGPTECTVTITRARLRSGRPITIGQPIGDNRAFVLDENLDDVGPGAAGELCIAGPGLARGYANRPDLTAEKFPEHPRLGRICRTGDLVRRDPHGDLVYLGRIDTQVKVRGYRIELTAIESRLAEVAGVAECACAVQGPPGRERIVAFVVPEPPDAPVDEAALAHELSRNLPAYMVPARFRAVPRLPTAVSGKLDRRALPAFDDDSPIGAGRAPRTKVEHSIATAVARALRLEEVGVDRDFFALGGNSLRAAELISELRLHPALASLAVRDVYEHRTVEALATLVGSERDHAATAAVVSPRRRGHPRACTAVQSVFLLAVLAAASGIAYVALWLVLPWLVARIGLVPLILAAPFAALAGLSIWAPVSIAIAASIKRLLIGRYEPGRAPVWGSLYLRHWIVQRCVRIVPWNALRGTEFFSVALRALGAEIGARVHVHRGVDLLDGGWDLLTIGDDATLSQDAALGLVEFDGGDIVFGTVTIGSASRLGIRAGMEAGSVLGERSTVTALSNVAAGVHVAADRRFDGVPAAPAGAAEPVEPRPPDLGPVAFGLRLIATQWLVGIVRALPFVAPLVVVLVTLEVSDRRALEWMFAASARPDVWLLAAAFAGVALAGRLAVDALLLRLTRPVAAGTYGRWSNDYVRIWWRTGLVDSAGQWLSGSLFWRWWLRLAGMRVGRNCEISTILDVLPERVAIGDETFFADGVYLGCANVERGNVTVADTVVGDRSFVGNHAVLPAGTEFSPEILVGVSTVADARRMREGTSWFGHPPFELPRREVVTADRALTHEPGPLRYLHRLAWETLRFSLPTATTAALLGWIEAVTRLGFAWTPVATLALAGTFTGIVVVLKWLLLGRVRPGTHGLWSAWCCRWDFLYMAWGRLAHGPLSVLGGTLWIAWYLRAMGMHIGRRVVLAGSFAQVVDPDMLTIDDDATVDALFQAHTFEDRVLKIGRLRIRAGATVRRGTVLFYGADVGEGSHVAPHGVVMKHERLAPHTRYAGCPTRRIG